MDYDYLKYKKILIVDDEADLREMVTSILEQDGFKTIKTAGTVAEALKICRDWEPDLAILDVMLPDGDGFSLFEQMRTFTEVPVLFLTARGEDEDKLKGLGLGADDYMVKPFAFEELLARIRSLGRRSGKWEAHEALSFGDISYDSGMRELTGPAGSLLLSGREGRLLEVFLREPDTVLRRMVLLSRVWGADAAVEESNLDTYIHFLRKRLDTVGSALALSTIRGVGYRLENPHVS